MTEQLQELALEEIQVLQTMGVKAYVQQVIGLFMSHRATAEQWQAMGEAVRAMSESGEGDKVACIDRALLRRPC